MQFAWKLGLKLFGWRTDLVFPYHHLPKYIILVGPHTSNWDFVIGLAYRNMLRMNKTRFLGKKELFKPPFGFIFYRLGGTPVDRKNSYNIVDDVVNLFDANSEFSIALSPEGTRKKVDKLRTGFYFIAKKAQVPVILVGLDYKMKQVKFSEPIMTTDSQSADIEKVIDFYRQIEGKNPDQGMTHL